MTIWSRQLAIGILLLPLGSSPSAFGQNSKQPAESGSPKALTDTTDFRSRFDVREEYQSLPGGSSRNLVVPRVEYALSPSFLLRTDIPYVTVDPNEPGTHEESGLGDITVRAQWRLAHTPAYALVAAAEFSLDTAQQPLLGTGRYIFQPLAYAVIGLPKYKSTVYPYVQQYWTFGGTTDVQINTTLLRSSVLTVWPKNVYTYVEPSVYINWAQDARTGGTLEIELGRFVTKGMGLYLRPGVGLWGPVYNWNFEVGVHYFF